MKTVSTLLWSLNKKTLLKDNENIETSSGDTIQHASCDLVTCIVPSSIMLSYFCFLFQFLSSEGHLVEHSCKCNVVRDAYGWKHCMCPFWLNRVNIWFRVVELCIYNFFFFCFLYGMVRLLLIYKEKYHLFKKLYLLFKVILFICYSWNCTQFARSLNFYSWASLCFSNCSFGFKWIKLDTMLELG